MATNDTQWLIARELPRLRRYARTLRDSAGADDLVQDCLERALRKQNLWRHGSNMRAWLFRILYNVHLSSLRSSNRVPYAVSLDDISGSVGEQGRQIPHIELGELARALDDLPAEQREVITLIALEGLRYDEAADVLGINMGTVRSRLSRGRAALRDATAGGAALDGRARPPAPHLRRVK